MSPALKAIHRSEGIFVYFWSMRISGVGLKHLQIILVGEICLDRLAIIKVWKWTEVRGNGTVNNLNLEIEYVQLMEYRLLTNRVDVNPLCRPNDVRYGFLVLEKHLLHTYISRTQVLH